MHVQNILKKFTKKKMKYIRKYQYILFHNNKKHHFICLFTDSLKRKSRIAIKEYNVTIFSSLFIT